MTRNYTCPKHGKIEINVVDTHNLLIAAAPTGSLPTEALPERRFVCARCVAEAIDGLFLPVRQIKG